VKRRHIRQDAVAGLPGAIASVPDGMASAVLVGVNPIYGLYASMTGPIAGGLTTSTKLMLVTTTTAAALAAGSALEGVAEADRPGALFLLTMMAGIVMILAGLARTGRYVRFVSHSVMIGFLTGVAVNIVLGQLGDLTGFAAEGANSLTKAWSVITNVDAINVASMITGLAAIAIILGLNRTKLAAVSALVAVVAPTLGVIVFGAGDVARVSDAGDIPGLTSQLLDQLQDTGTVTVSGPIHPVTATEMLGQSTLDALHEAQSWLVEHRSTQPE
jgi:sulfate permease, SulP family